MDEQAANEDYKESFLEALSDCDHIENLVEVPHNTVDIMVSERPEETNERNETDKSEKDYIKEEKLDTKEYHKIEENNQNIQDGFTQLTSPHEQQEGFTSLGQSLYSPREEVPPSTKLTRRGGPISNTIHMMLCVDTLYNNK